ncbi:hypothetical protein EDD11_004911 [Mortierella claussenii]|nr:hypothetical protein EDD11_004911 [Mortierella claussenii]
MLADRNTRPQSIVLEVPPYNPSSSGPKSVNSQVPSREVRDVNTPASPQPQQNTGHHHPQPSQHQPTYRNRTQQTQQSPAHPRRSSADRGAKDSTKTKSSIPKPAPEHVGPYLLGRTLGKGSSGCVKLARHRKTNEQVAVKIISKASLANKAAVNRGIEREIAIMKLINHSHVIRLYDVYETEKELFLIMEYVSGGELFEYLVNKGRLDEAEALRFFQQIIVGLAFCHKRNICHRDLKPENLLLDDRMNVKIADFGMASLQKTGRLLETSCGSPHYASPEVVTGLKYDGSSSDIWSCGIILYALLTGHLPFDDENIRQLLSKVKAGKFYMPTDISTGARDLISRMLTVNPKRRITMQEVMVHPWFRMVNANLNTLGEPAEDPESGRPLLAEELDAEIILHMRWLFAPGPSHSNPEAKEVYDEEALLREIEEKMTSSEENMEKLFYHLLCQHKTELLENYSGDDNGSTLPDGPRRRADSFPNSAASVRSHTPDFGRSLRSPRDSPLTPPGVPSLVMADASSAEPSPLSLNPLEAAVARAASAAKIAARTPSPSIVAKQLILEAADLKESQAQHTQSSAVEFVAIPDQQPCATASDSKDIKLGETDSEPSGHPVVYDPKDAKRVEIDSEELSGHPIVVVPMPICSNSQQSSIPHEASQIAVPNTVSLSKKQEAVIVQPAKQSAPVMRSIESQVLSTQIAEPAILTLATATVESTTDDCSAAIPSAVTTAPTAPTATTKPAAIAMKPQRPILHPLDVKASSGTTAMNVCASQHSRRYSEGTQSPQSPTPLSPNRPKRSWFTRLFDFKPQPLIFPSNWSATETQERLEVILKDLFHDDIQMESYKKPVLGIKCRYEGGFISDQQVKAVKFKIEVTEKAGYLAPSPSDASSSSATSSSGSHIASSSAVAAILATVDLHHGQRQHQRQQHLIQHQGNHSLSHLPPVSSGANGDGLGKVLGSIPVLSGVASRRASDGGSILSSAAAAISASLAAAARSSFHHHYYSSHRHSYHLHHRHRQQPSSTGASSTVSAHSGHGGASSSMEHPSLPQMSILPRKTVKVTLHQQQGANSTLKMIYEQLQLVWEQQQSMMSSSSVSTTATTATTATSVGGMSGSSELGLITSPPSTMNRAPRGAAI